MSPLAVSGVAIGVDNLKLTAGMIAAMQLATVGVEVFTASRVWRSSLPLQEVKHTDDELDPADGEASVSFKKRIATWSGVLRRYASSPVTIPSIAWVFQPLSVLTLSASMMVYLRSVNFPLEQVTAARTLSTAMEITATVVTPLLISYLRGRSRPQIQIRDRDFQPLIVVGLLGLSWQVCVLVPAVVSLIMLPDRQADPTSTYPAITTVLLVTLAIARLGPFIYALIEQQLVQTVVPVDRRVEFSGTEMALFSFAELSRWGLTGIFGNPHQFKGVAVASFGAVVAAAALFWWWTWRWRQRLTAPHIT